MRLWVDVLNSSDQKLGAGPIMDVLGWEAERRMDSAGTWSMEIPIMAARSDLLTYKRKVRCYGVPDYVQTGTEGTVTVLPSPAVQDLGGGVIEKISYRLQTDGSTTMVVEGMDLLHDLARVSVLSRLDDTTITAWLTSILPAGWTFTVVNPLWGDPISTEQIYAQFRGGSVLEALIKIAERHGHHFRLGTGKQIIWFSQMSPSGVRCIQAGDPIALEEAPELALIQELGIDTESFEIVNRVYAVGGDYQGKTFTMASATTTPASVTAPNGEKWYYVDEPTSQLNYGVLERMVTWSDIVPQADTAGDTIRAADELMIAAETQLAEWGDPQRAFTLSVAKLDQRVNPGTSVQVLYRDVRDGRSLLDIDEDLWIVGTTERVDNDGVHTVRLEVSNNGRSSPGDTTAITDELTRPGNRDDNPGGDPAVARSIKAGSWIRLDETTTQVEINGLNYVKHADHTSTPIHDVYGTGESAGAFDDWYDCSDQPTTFRVGWTAYGHNPSVNNSVGAQFSVNWDHDPLELNDASQPPRDWAQIRVKDDTVTTAWSPWRKLAWLDEIGADLAERYHADRPYPPGTLVRIGGDHEITRTTRIGEQAFGVISTSPAYRMNSRAGTDDTHPFVALIGRVPCLVVGPVRTGTWLIASEIPGVACASVPHDVLTAFRAIGQSLVDDDMVGTRLIEITLRR